MPEQLCDICGRPMKLVRTRRVGAGKDMKHNATTTERTYACICGEFVKVRKGIIVAAKWFDTSLVVTFRHPMSNIYNTRNTPPTYPTSPTVTVSCSRKGKEVRA